MLQTSPADQVACESGMRAGLIDGQGPGTKLPLTAAEKEKIENESVNRILLVNLGERERQPREPMGNRDSRSGSRAVATEFPERVEVRR